MPGLVGVEDFELVREETFELVREEASEDASHRPSPIPDMSAEIQLQTATEDALEEVSQETSEGHRVEGSEPARSLQRWP